MGGGSSLPYDAEIEYLESTGTQWINTGIKLLENATGILRFRCKGLINDGGSLPTLVNAMKEVRPWPGFCLRIDNRVALIWSSTFYRNWNPNQLFEIDHTHDLSGQNHDWPLTLFCAMRNLTTPMRQCIGKLYYLRIDINDVMVVDFIPVRIGTTGYLYDKVSGTLFGNAGTGSFTLGPDKT